MTDELKPCPFCGGEAALIEDSSHSTAYSVGCFNGDCEIEPYDWQEDVTKAIAAWNTRADLPATEEATASLSNAQIMDNPKVQALVAALIECRYELDAYSQNEYPSDHPVHMAYRKRDYDANPARKALAALEAGNESQKDM